MNVQCPACGTFVAETATMCPYCGFRGDDPNQPIYKQGEYRPVPVVPCEIVVDDGRSCEIRLSDEDNKNLFRHLADWNWLSTMLPALAETLESIFGGTVHLEAKLPEHIMHMIEEGKLHFATDKTARFSLKCSMNATKSSNKCVWRKSSGMMRYYRLCSILKRRLPFAW